MHRLGLSLGIQNFVFRVFFDFFFRNMNFLFIVIFFFFFGVGGGGGWGGGGGGLLWISSRTHIQCLKKSVKNAQNRARTPRSLLNWAILGVI